MLLELILLLMELILLLLELILLLRDLILLVRKRGDTSGRLLELPSNSLLHRLEVLLQPLTIRFRLVGEIRPRGFAPSETVLQDRGSGDDLVDLAARVVELAGSSPQVDGTLIGVGESLLLRRFEALEVADPLVL